MATIQPQYIVTSRAPLKRLNPENAPSLSPKKNASIETLVADTVLKTSDAKMNPLDEVKSIAEEKAQDWKKRFTDTVGNYYSFPTNNDKHQRTMTVFIEFQQELSLIQTNHPSPLLPKCQELFRIEFENLLLNDEIFKRTPLFHIPANPRHIDFQATIISSYTEEPIAKGSFGSVVKRKYSDNKEMVVKSPLMITEQMKTLVKEESIWGALLKHPNITCFLGADGLNLMFELAERSLSDYIKTTEISSKMCIPIIRDIANALAYLRRENIVHRDLKPDNVLVFPGECYKIADFGFACNTLDIYKNIKGTLAYTAPEVFDDKYGKKNCSIDLWSLGVVLFNVLQKHKKQFVTELLKNHFSPYTKMDHSHLRKFFNETTIENIKLKIKQMLDFCFEDLKDNPLSFKLLELMKSLLTVPSSERLSADGVLTRLEQPS